MCCEQDTSGSLEELASEVIRGLPEEAAVRDVAQQATETVQEVKALLAGAKLFGSKTVGASNDGDLESLQEQRRLVQEAVDQVRSQKGAVGSYHVGDVEGVFEDLGSMTWNVKLEGVHKVQFPIERTTSRTSIIHRQQVVWDASLPTPNLVPAGFSNYVWRSFSVRSQNVPHNM